MKNNKILIIIAVLLLNVLAAYMIGQSLMGKESEYDMALAEARKLAKQELCSLSIDKYNEAISLEDSLDIRLEMMDVYERGIKIGEFSKTYTIFMSVTDMVEVYREEPRAYERACQLLLEYNRYEEVANLLMQARDLHVNSERIETFREEVRYRFVKYYSMYTDVQPSLDEMYTVQTENGYSFLNAEGSPQFDGAFIMASSFSEGYAFVRSPYPDGPDKNYLINKDGQRLVYMDEVESSSGVGKAQNAAGENIYLLACKVGDRYHYYNVNGEKVFGDYIFAGRFRNNVAAVMEQDGQWKLINGTGKPIVDTVFTDVILNEFDECAAKGIVIAKSDDQYRFYNPAMQQIGDFTCDSAKSFVDDYAAFEKDGQWGFVGADGKVLIEPQYEDAKSFSNGMGAIKVGGSWMFISEKNEIVIQESFQDVGYLSDQGLCFVKSDDYWSYLKMYYTGD